LHTFSLPSWWSIFFSFTEHLAVLFSCAVMHLLDALLAELLMESSVILVSSNSQWSSFLCALLAQAQCPLGRAPTELLRDSVCNCASATQPRFLRCSVTSKVFFSPELLISVLCLSTSSFDSSEFRSALMHLYSESATLCHALQT